MHIYITEILFIFATSKPIVDCSLPLHICFVDFLFFLVHDENLDLCKICEGKSAPLM